MTQDMRAGTLSEGVCASRATAKQRTMFVEGLCWGAMLTFLYAIRDYDTLVFAFAIEVIWTACFGWPWEK